MKKPYEIIHQDEDLLIVNKASGLHTLPDRYRADVPNLQHLLQRDFGSIWVVHRLDRETSGILCFARNAEAHQALNEQFLKRKPEKWYQALVKGLVIEEQGEIDQPIGPHPNIEGKMAVVKGAKPSKTHYEVVARYRHHTWLNCQIFTGRTHQIRVHLAHLGHPLAVDALYGGAEALYLSELKQRNFRQSKYTEGEQALLRRVPLHAAALRIEHPKTGQSLFFEAKLPKDLKAVQQQLSKWSAYRGEL